MRPLFLKLKRIVLFSQRALKTPTKLQLWLAQRRAARSATTKECVRPLPRARYLIDATVSRPLEQARDPVLDPRPRIVFVLKDSSALPVNSSTVQPRFGRTRRAQTKHVGSSGVKPTTLSAMGMVRVNLRQVRMVKFQADANVQLLTLGRCAVIHH